VCLDPESRGLVSDDAAPLTSAMWSPLPMHSPQTPPPQYVPPPPPVMPAVRSNSHKILPRRPTEDDELERALAASEKDAKVSHMPPLAP
jgi:hypothetical protein